MIGIAEAIESGELRPDELDELTDEEVIEALVALKGIGRWSAEMFLIFDLGRPDVFSGGDLGLRRGNPDRLRARGAADARGGGRDRRVVEPRTGRSPPCTCGRRSTPNNPEEMLRCASASLGLRGVIAWQGRQF